MADDIKRFEDKLDKVVENINEIKITQAKQQVILDAHIRRTEILEEVIIPLKEDHDQRVGRKELVLIIATVGAGIEGLKVLFEHFMK